MTKWEIIEDNKFKKQTGGKTLPKAQKGLLTKIKSTLNPLNIGVPDYTDKYKTWNEAYSAAKKAGLSEIMWNKGPNPGRKNLDYAGTPAQEMKSYGITGEQRVFNPSTVRKNLGRLDTEEGYDTKLSEVFKQLFDSKNPAVVNNEEPAFGIEKDAFRLYLGLPQEMNSFTPSKYQKGAFEIVNYNQMLPEVLDENIENLIKTKGNPEKEFKYGEHIEGGNSPIKPYGDIVMGKHTVKKGKDDKGEYIEYADKWDLDSYKVGNVAVGQIADMVNKPFSIYGRVYYKDYGDGVKRKMYYSDNELKSFSTDKNNKNFNALDLQKELVNRGYELPNSMQQDDYGNLNFDGIYGNETKQALQDFQSNSTPAPKMAVSLPGQSTALPPELKNGGIIEDPMGQWAHPGSITRIPSNQITMQGVNYPVLGVSDRGHTQMMYPGEDYSFRGKSVTEYPMMQGGGKPSLKNQILNTRLPATNRPTLNPNFNRSTSTTSPLSLQALGKKDYGISLNRNGLNLSAGLNLEDKKPAFRAGIDYGKGNWSGSANYSTDNNNFGTQVGYNNNGFNAGAGYQRNNNNNSFNANVGYDGDSPVNFNANYAYDKDHSFDTNVGLNLGKFSGGLNYGYNQEGDRAHNFGANANLGLGKNLNLSADANFDSNKNYQVNAGLKYNFQDGGEVNFTYAGENHRVYEKVSPTGNGKGIEGHIMVNHPTENKKRWDTIDLTKITNGKVKTVLQGVASTKKWHKENPEYANGGRISNWEIIEDMPKFQKGGQAPSFDDSNTTTDVPFDNKTLSTSGDFSPEEIQKIEDYTTKESENRIELIDNYTLLTPEQQKRYDEQKEIASYNDSLAKYEKAKIDWEKDKSYFTASKDGIAFPSNYDDLSSFADYCDPQYGCSGAQGRGSTGIIRNGDYSHKIEYFEKPKLSKELEKKIKDRQLIQNNKDKQKQEEIKTTTSTDTKIPLTVITNTNEKTTPTVIEHSTVNSPDKRYFTGISGSLYRNPRTGAFEHKVYKADGVTGKRLTESYFESDLTNSGSTPVFTADDPAYYSNHPDIYRIRTDSSKTWNPETKKFEAKTWIENKATGESVTDPSFSPVPMTPPESATPPTYTQYGNPSPTVPVSKIKTVQGDYKNGGKILNLGNIKRLPKAGNGLISEITSTLNPKNWGVKDYSKSGTRDQAYAAARKAGEKEFMWNNERFSTRKDTDPIKYIGTNPNQKEFDETLRNDYPEFFKTLNRGKNVGAIRFKGMSENQPNREAILPYKTNSMITVGENPKDSKNFMSSLIAESSHLKDPKLYKSSFNPYYLKGKLEKKLHGEEVYNIPDNVEYDDHRLFEPGMALTAYGDLSPEDIKRIQASLGVEQDGYFGPQTYKALQNQYKDNYNVTNALQKHATMYKDTDKNPISMGKDDNLSKAYLTAINNNVPLKQPEKFIDPRSSINVGYSDYALKSNAIENMDPKILQSSLYNRGYNLPKSVNSFFKFDGVVGDETKQAYDDFKQRAMKTSMLSVPSIKNNYEQQDNTKVAAPIINKTVIAPKMAVQKPGQSVALPPQFKKGGKTKKSSWQIIEY